MSSVFMSSVYEQVFLRKIAQSQDRFKVMMIEKQRLLLFITFNLASNSDLYKRSIKKVS